MSHLELLQRWSQGDRDALMQLLDNERENLFDYLIRMTGEVTRSYESTEEVLYSLYQHAEKYDSYDILRMELYKTARSFSRDIWNSDTSKLELLQHSHKLVANQNEVTSAEFTSQGPCHNSADTFFRSLPGSLREVLLLKYRYQFSFDEMKKIMSTSRNDVAELLELAEIKLRELYPELSDLASEIKAMPVRPLPKENYSTLALSELVRDVVKRKWSLANLFRYLILGLLIATGLALILFYLSPFILELVF